MDRRVPGYAKSQPQEWWDPIKREVINWPAPEDENAIPVSPAEAKVLRQAEELRINVSKDWRSNKSSEQHSGRK